VSVVGKSKKKNLFFFHYYHRFCSLCFSPSISKEMKRILDQTPDAQVSFPTLEVNSIPEAAKKNSIPPPNGVAAILARSLSSNVSYSGSNWTDTQPANNHINLQVRVKKTVQRTAKLRQLLFGKRRIVNTFMEYGRPALHLLNITTLNYELSEQTKTGTKGEIEGEKVSLQRWFTEHFYFAGIGSEEMPRGVKNQMALRHNELAENLETIMVQGSYMAHNIWKGDIRVYDTLGIRLYWKKLDSDITYRFDSVQKHVVKSKNDTWIVQAEPCINDVGVTAEDCLITVGKALSDANARTPSAADYNDNVDTVVTGSFIGIRIQFGTAK
jgi:hypothetical protein